MSILLALQIGSPRLSEGKQGCTACLWCLNSGPETRTSGANCFYLFHLKQRSGKRWWARPFSCPFHIVNYLPAGRTEFLWLEAGVHLRDGARGFFLPSLCRLAYSHARRWIPTLFYLLSISSWLPFVFTQSWQIWGLITFTHGSIGESPQGLLQERNIWKEFFLRFGEQQCWSSEVNFMSLGALWIMNKWLSFPWTAA